MATQTQTLNAQALRIERTYDFLYGKSLLFIFLQFPKSLLNVKIIKIKVCPAI